MVGKVMLNVDLSVPLAL